MTLGWRSGEPRSWHVWAASGFLKKIKISWPLTSDLNKKSQVTSHWSGPGVRVKRSEVTSLRSNVLYFQRSKVSQFIWVHKVKGQKSKVMGMGPIYVQHSGFWKKVKISWPLTLKKWKTTLIFIGKWKTTSFFIKWKTTLIFFKWKKQCLLHYVNIMRIK